MVKKIRAPVQRRACHDIERDATTRRAGLEITVGNDFLNELDQIHRAAQLVVEATVDPREREQLLDEVIEAAGLRVDSTEIFRRLRRRIAPGEFGSNGQTRERGP